MSQTICTEIRPAINGRPKRVRAVTTSRISLTLTYEDDWKELDNHMEAAIRLAEQVNWVGTAVCGTLNRNGDKAWVFIEGEPYFTVYANNGPLRSQHTQSGKKYTL